MIDWGTCGDGGASYRGPGTCTLKVSYTAGFLGLAHNTVSVGQTSVASGVTVRHTIPESATEVESVPPTTTVSATAGKSRYAFGTWAAFDVVVQLAAVDNADGSGVARTEYSLDGDDTWTGTRRRSG